MCMLAYDALGKNYLYIIEYDCIGDMMTFLDTKEYPYEIDPKASEEDQNEDVRRAFRAASYQEALNKLDAAKIELKNIVFES